MVPLRVLLLSHEYPKPGDSLSGVAAHRQVLALRDVGCDVRVVSPVPYVPSVARTSDVRRALAAVPRRYSLDGIMVSSPRYLRLPGAWFRPVAGLSMASGATRDVCAAVREFRPQLLHAYAATPDGRAAVLLGRKYNLPTVCTLIGSDINDYPLEGGAMRRVTTRTLQATDHLVAVSFALVRAIGRLAGANVTADVVYMGCDPSKFRFDGDARNQLRERLGITGEECLVLFLGYMHQTKGVHELLEATARLVQKGLPMRLAMVGWSDDLEALAQAAAALGLSECLHIEVLPPHEDVPAWLSASDIFALPSHSEGLPLAVLEAMACSRPIVASSVGGIPEAVSNGVQGLLVPPRNVAALAQGLERLATNPDAARTMGLAGRRAVEEHFTWAHSALRMREVYERSIAYRNTGAI